jgi:hypothetical protein
MKATTAVVQVRTDDLERGDVIRAGAWTIVGHCESVQQFSLVDWKAAHGFRPGTWPFFNGSEASWIDKFEMAPFDTYVVILEEPDNTPDGMEWRIELYACHALHDVQVRTVAS